MGTTYGRGESRAVHGGKRRAPGRVARASTFAALVLTCLALPGAAWAGSYRVLSCDAAPSGANNAWQPGAQRGMAARTACPSRGSARRGLLVRNRPGTGVVRGGHGARMTFVAPRGATLASIRFDWDGRRATGDWRVGLSRGDGRLIAGCRVASPSRRDACRLGDPRRRRPYVRSLAGQRLVRLEAVCSARRGCSTDRLSGPAGPERVRLAMHSAVVEVRDATAPALTGPGGSLLVDGWQSGVRVASLRAGDSVGIRSTVLEVEGRPRSGRPRDCDFTRRVPCPREVAAEHRLDTHELSDGTHRVALVATDAAGNAGRHEQLIRVDNHAPEAVTGVRLLGEPGVRATNSFDLRWSPPSGQAAPLASAHYRLCPATGPGDCVRGERQGAVTGIDDLAVPARGAWRFRVWLEDEAGNADAANASKPVTLRFDERMTAHLEARIAGPHGGASERTVVPFGRRPLVSGTLEGADGAPVSGAPIAVLSRVRGTKRVRREGAVRTDGLGRFGYRARRGPSRTLLLRYPGGERHRPAGGAVRLAVRARSSLRVSRRHVRNGERVRFSGRLLGGHVPPEGKLVQLEAFYRGRWRTFAVVRTSPRGRWSRRYRFEATTGRVVYPFRVRIPRERGYPYAVGRSRVVRVTVNG